MQKLLVAAGALALTTVAASSPARADVNQPQEIVMRPMTTPGAQITIGGDLIYFMIGDANATGLDLGGSFGVNDSLEVGLRYGFSLDEFEAKGDLEIEAAYAIMEGNLGVAANVEAGYSILAEGATPLGLGARIRFRVNDQLAIISPGSQLQIALEGDPKPITLGLPIGVGYQVSPALFAFVNTSIGNLSIANSESTFLFADFIPLQAGAFFSPSNTIDVGAALSFLDLKDDAGNLAITLAGRLHM